MRGDAMIMRRALAATPFLACALLAAGCVTPPPEVRIHGVLVPGSWVEKAEAGSGSEQARACLSISRKLFDRDLLESLRYLRKGAEQRNAECCRQYLTTGESAAVNLSQRLYVRLFVERLLRRGPILTESGEDIRSDLYVRLSRAWCHTPPVSPSKAKQVLESMLECGVEPRSTSSASLAQMIRDAGLRAHPGWKGAGRLQGIQMYAGESAEAARRWLQIPELGGSGAIAGWCVNEANAWGGGSDRLVQSTGVLAFLVNAQGEPTFRGDHLWICNLGTSPAYVTSTDIGRSNYELVPGQEETIPLASAGLKQAEPTTGISLAVRSWRRAR
jgi:hypothetical protein